MCKNGFTLNKDGLCEKIKAPLCTENSSFYNQQYYAPANPNHNIFYNYYISISGCHTCNSGYQAFSLLSKDYRVCFYSTYDYVEQFIQFSNYISSCKHYKAVNT